MNVLSRVGRLAACAVALSAVFSVRAVDMGFYRSLVAIPSVSEDARQVNRAMRAMKAYLEPKGVCCVIETMPSGREVLYASTTPGKRHDVVLAAHLDVVPAVSDDQYAMKADGPDRVRGRGTGDCKGCCVAVAQALVKLVGKASVGCIFGADEEIGGTSTAWMVEEKGYRPGRMVLVVDGSYNAIVYAIKGQTMFRVRANGRGGHSSAPWNADDSILAITKAYGAIREAWDRKHPLADDKWSDVLSATVIRSEGDAMNRIPDDVSLVLNLRSTRPESKDEALKLLREVTGLEVEVVRHSPPCSRDPDHPLVRRLQGILKDVNGADIVLERANYATDARCFASCPVPVVTVGILEGNAHGKDEWACVSSVDRMTETLVRFCSSLPPQAQASGGALTVLGAGDLFMVRNFPEGYAVSDGLKGWIASADARLINFEAVVNDGTCPPNAWSGGTWAIMPPEVLPDFLKFGFNGCGCANNHSLDYSREGLAQTRAALSAAGLPFAGIGRDLQEATAAAFVETPNGRVAFVSVNCEFHPDAMAGLTTSRSPGRPGMNGLRHRTKYFVSAEQLESLKAIAEVTTVNGSRALEQKDGFKAPDPPGCFSFGGHDFAIGARPGKLTYCNSNDLSRIVAEIARARSAADCVVVLAHSHNIRGTRYDEPDFYFLDFCRAAIDAGATAVFGGGTHQLKGIEFRDGRPIFYSLGDFVFQNSVTPSVPPDFCEQYGVPPDSPAEVALSARSKGGKVGLHTDRANFLSVLPRLRVEGGRVVRVEMLPVELGFGLPGVRNGLPDVADAETAKFIAGRLETLSRPFGTRIGLSPDGILTAEPVR